jgi:hypothetical protein
VYGLEAYGIDARRASAAAQLLVLEFHRGAMIGYRGAGLRWFARRIPSGNRRLGAAYALDLAAGEDALACHVNELIFE